MKNALFVSERYFNIDEVYSEEAKARLAASLRFLPPVKSGDELPARKKELAEVDVIFSTWGMLRLSREEIKEYFPRLTAVYYAAGTVQYFARPFLENGVAVHSAARANGVPVTEVTVAQILLANKGFFTRRVKCRADWNNNDPAHHFPGNYGTRVGLLGAGVIGTGVIERLRPYALDLLVFDPFLSAERAAALGVRRASMAEIFATCHVISNHLANKPETVGIISRALLASMAEDAVFINTGRGAQVDMAALADEMRDHPGRLALLDVTDPEEPPREDSPLYTLPNIFLTPHIAGSIGYETHRLADYMVEDYETVEAGGKPQYEVTLAMLETMA